MPNYSKPKGSALAGLFKKKGAISEREMRQVQNAKKRRKKTKKAAKKKGNISERELQRFSRMNRTR
tara:strand:+ start:61 stop:258 length:198 start_codon:yes stop_codon:yes gene_type:complete